MHKTFNSQFTMFVYLDGHRLLEYYFDLDDPRDSANDRADTASAIAPRPSAAYPSQR